MKATSKLHLKSLASDIKVNIFNRDSANKAYEKLLNCNDFSHRKIGQLFVQVHLEDIQAAAGSNPIISDQNQAFHRLASDWRLTDPNPQGDRGIPHPNQKPQLYTPRAQTPAGCTQCFLNEYVYWQSDEDLKTMDRI